MGTRSQNSLALRPPNLRLAQTGEEGVAHLRTAAVRRAIAQENHAAALGADDVRWMFAQAVRDGIEGGRAAIMPPQVRRRLVSQAQNSGLRPFDANLIIAIVQDAARHGESLKETAAGRLALIPGAPAKATIGPMLLLGAAVGLAAGLVALLVGWLMG
jgi:hypothetical protein